MNKKNLKLSIYGALLTSAILAGTITPIILLNQNTNQSNEIAEPNQKAGDSDYRNELEYIKNDAEKQGNINYKVASIKLVDNISGYVYHSAAIVTKTNNTKLLYMWGSNQNAQLGNGSTENSATPILVKPTYFNSVIKDVVLSNENTGVLLEDGSFYVWGDNYYGQMGDGTSGRTLGLIPSKVDPLYFANKKIVKVSAGYRAFTAISEDGSAYLWGMNNNGQLAVDLTTIDKLIPTKIISTSFSSRIVSQIVLGTYHGGALLDDGSLYMWGSNYAGQLGNGISGAGAKLQLPTKIDISSFASPIKRLILSSNTTTALLEDGSLYMWGDNGYGQLGIGSRVNATTPVKVNTSSFTSAIKQAGLCGGNSAALLDDGSLYTWGYNQYGQLGNGTTANVNIPTLVNSANFGFKKVTQIALGQDYTSALLENNMIYMWGNNTSSQLGITRSNTPNTLPIFMPNLSADSHITANVKITAKEAVDNSWVNNTFNPSGFKTSFNLHNIPDVPGQTFTMATKPTYNNLTGTLSTKVGVKYFYNENGLIVANNTINSIALTEFMPSITKILVKNDPKTDIVIDKWLNSVKELTYIDRQKIEEYLLLEEVPQGAIFEILGITQNLQTGVLKFNITSSLTTRQDGSQTGKSDLFAITLNLTPRITTLTTRTNYNKIAVDKLKDLIFDSNGVAITDEIKKYINYDATVEGATLNLKPNSYVINTGMGTANFTVFFDKYYDASGAEKSQTASSLTKSFDVNLQLLPMATVITSKTSYTSTHRVDRFISTFTDTNGNVTNETILKQYVDLQNLPTGYTLKVINVNIIDPINGTISFDLIASKYNDRNFILQVNGTFPIQLMKLLPKYPTTNISAKAEGEYDDTVRLDRFIELFAPAAGGVATDIDKLGEFLDLVSIPDTATVTVNNIVKTDVTGKITFNVIVNKYYDEISDLKTANKTFPVTLYLGIKYITTEITAKTNIGYPERIDRFETKIKELANTADLQAYLVPKYITITGDLPKIATFDVANIVSDLDTGIMSLDLIASDYYDENSDPQKIKAFALTLGLGIKYAPTVLVAKAKADLGSERIDRFAHTIAMFTNQNLKNYLEDYVDGVETLAAGSSLVASNVAKNENTGTVSFDVSTDRYYDADSDFRATTETWSISLELTVKLTPTTIEAKTGDFTNIRVDSLIPSFTNDQLVVTNRSELNKYVNITGIPSDAQLSIKDPNMSFSTGVITFKIVADKFYDGEADLITTRSDEYVITLNLGIKYQPTVIKAIKGYVQTENVKTFADQIKTLTGDALKTYLATYIQTTGDLPAGAVMSVDANTVTYDEDTGAVSFSLLVDKYYDVDGSLKTNGSFKIRLRLANQ